ncbi:PAS domain-containing sensor histidine kinase [Salinimicrobium sp. MT39]|jgi:PAS domain S-box-containing protein|uniref:histidine kinase n=1 Tax=Salinimicrobium profundisediminis TaxID=2994553 RepID=A0A9X3CYV1_9FLAO|nr:PAS domain-containing sensor histidine kinase [Salinimicrobium profundisediminis]MCX2839185.1 PAS domain-containing sensor histidine kinase [Salinimicrobium profundisediminis]
MTSPTPINQPDLEAFFRLSHDNLCIAGYDGYIRKINPAFIKLLGYSEEELFAVPISSFVHPEDKEITAETRSLIMKDKPLLNFENRYITKTGEIVWLSWTSIPDHSKELIYGVSKNITHKKKLEEDRQLLIKDLTAINTGLKQLTYTISHDLRSPVSNMMSIFSLLDLSQIQDEDSLQYLDLLEKSVLELKDTLDDQMEHLKETLLLKSTMELIPLKEVFQATTDSIRSLIDGSEAKFEIDFSQVEFLLANSFYLHSIFLNLITNSIKYAIPGIPPIIRISSQKDKDISRLLFTDNGIGFDMGKNGSKIFTLNQVFTDQSNSNGVGLYLVKNYMNSVGGTINVTSEVNAGSTFCLTFRNQNVN